MRISDLRISDLRISDLRISDLMISDLMELALKCIGFDGICIEGWRTCFECQIALRNYMQVRMD